MKHAFIILGNGFTIDFLQHYAEMVDFRINDSVDVCNLFRLGDTISSPWDAKPGFYRIRTVLHYGCLAQDQGIQRRRVPH